MANLRHPFTALTHHPNIIRAPPCCFPGSSPLRHRSVLGPCEDEESVTSLAPTLKRSQRSWPEESPPPAEKRHRRLSSSEAEEIQWWIASSSCIDATRGNIVCEQEPPGCSIKDVPNFFEDSDEPSHPHPSAVCIHRESNGIRDLCTRWRSITKEHIVHVLGDILDELYYATTDIPGPSMRRAAQVRYWSQRRGLDVSQPIS